MCFSFASSYLPHRLVRLTLAVGLVATGSSCQKVITVPLRTSATQLVVEGNLADDGQPCRVRLSTSTSYDDANTFGAVSGATVTLADDAGHQETLREAPAGQYVGSSVLGVPGRRYTLRVLRAGTTYEASSTLPSLVVAFDDLQVPNTAGSGPTGGRQAQVTYTDPVGAGNSYLFRQYRNGVLTNTITVQNDQYTDGKLVRLTLRNPGSQTSDLAVGDSLVVEMQNIDAGVYEYFRTLNQILQSNPLLSTTPANPATNVSGGALGYFSAHSRRVRRVRVP